MGTSFPEWVEPMAATLTQERFTGADWVFERKFDGIRLLAFREGPEVRLLSRNRLPQNAPCIADAIAGLPVRDIILDGEVTCDKSGMAYHVFDILWLDGRDVMSLPRVQEAAALRACDVDFDPTPSVHLHGKGDKWRVCPLWAETAALLKKLLSEQRPASPPDLPIFNGARAPP